jgi:hypothetical protein
MIRIIFSWVFWISIALLVYAIYKYASTPDYQTIALRTYAEEPATADHARHCSFCARSWVKKNEYSCVLDEE